ncbi:SDR family NAD(P)-dependent oxidoreductase [Mycobacterium talmoniae]|uniref:7-alpha-hydroxysteroid dehydrogenase n=1 Tax=Mycobacterium talmoniae TaxID=1858794 RepID=A0A1S1NUE8_9MYCO|nr:SDR family NAD(P)-dependent oxidoreductase [Mycobacterium talmoniae]OHV06924.1 7-alpha-hydroxysteroid dehydrogenase [Mycobacterium talmoniae]PQM48004.1 NADP-dependent 7-alpha-hydroxysteroid dehydrogenase [Mycobacterium talmoniae]
MSSTLGGRVALVTGAASGIGAASSRALATAGAAVAVTDVDIDAATAVAAAIKQTGGQALALRLDVAEEQQWATAIATVRDQLGPVTVLHSNAADISIFVRDNDLLNLEAEVWDRAFAVAARGSMLAAKHTLPHMIEAGRGSIVYTSSVKGRTGSSTQISYSSAKGAIDSLTRVIATTYGQFGVRCNAVAPGVVDTPAARANVPDELRRQIIDSQLLSRLAEPEDIAHTVVFLASDAAAMITGHTLVVDGGMTEHVPVLSPRNQPIA